MFPDPIRLALLLAAAAHAGGFGANYHVTRTDDPAPDGCRPDDCSLREAVLAASANADPFDNITLPAGTFAVRAPALEIAGGLRVFDAGMASTLIVGDGADDLFHIDSDAQFSMTGLSLDAGGKSEFYGVVRREIYFEAVRAPNPAGRLRASGDGDMAAMAVTGGSELAAAFVCGAKHCRAYDSRLARFATTLDADLNFPSSNVDLDNVTIDGALAPDAASGLDVATGGAVSASDVTIRDTRDGAAIGGLSIFGEATATLARLSCVGNAAPLRLENRVVADIVDSEFRDNVAGDADDALPGALDVASEGTVVTVERSSFIGNRGLARSGGAVRLREEAALTIRNSTFSDNLVRAAAAAAGARGGAIGFDGDIESLNLHHVTVAAPTFVPTGLAGSALGGYPGDEAASILLLNSIVRGSCKFAAGDAPVAGGSLESPADTCRFGDGNRVGVSADALALGALGYHGGRTQTFVPADASVAVDAGLGAPFCLTADQRRYARPYGAGCDAGAVEASDVLFADGLE